MIQKENLGLNKSYKTETLEEIEKLGANLDHATLEWINEAENINKNVIKKMKQKKVSTTEIGQVHDLLDELLFCFEVLHKDYIKTLEKLRIINTLNTDLRLKDERFQYQPFN